MENKVYVLISQMYEDIRIHGVFDTREAAENYMKDVGHINERIRLIYGKEQWEDDEEMWFEIVETERKTYG